ncbi:hypothetical protein [Burkholderia glumae]|nr:hypothetical protein [Burkholderia glumae]
MAELGPTTTVAAPRWRLRTPTVDGDPERTVDDLQSGHRSALQQLIARA